MNRYTQILNRELKEVMKCNLSPSMLLSNRAYFYLNIYGIITFGDLFACTPTNFCKSSKCGKRTVYEIKRELRNIFPVCFLGLDESVDDWLL